MGDISNWRSPIIGPKKKLIEDVDRADVIAKAKELIMVPGQKFEVPVGLKHQILGLEDTDMFEFSTTHSESDSHRIIKGD